MNAVDRTIPPAPKASSRKKEKGATHFWRACRFLYPYRWMVTVSVLCAIFVAGSSTTGLGALLPIMRVLIKGDTILTWANREISQHRIGLSFSDESHDLQIVTVKKHEHRPLLSWPGTPTPLTAAAQAGLEDGDRVVVPQINGQPDQAPVLAALADPNSKSATIDIRDKGPVTIALRPLYWYEATGQRIAAWFPGKDRPVQALAMALAFVVALAIVANIVKFFQEYLSDKSAVLAVNDIRRRLYDRVLHIPLSHFNLRGTSDVTSRLTQDAQGLNEGFKTILGQSIQEPAKAIMAFALALFISWPLTLFIVFFAPIMVAFIRKFGKKMRRASKKALVSSAVMLGQIDGSLVGIRVVKGANAERFERRRYTRIMNKLVAEQLRMSRIDSFSEPTMETLTLFVVAGVVLCAAYMMMVKKTLELTDFILVMACLGSIGDSLRRLSKVNNVLQKANSAAGRIFEIMDLPAEKRKEPASLPAKGAALVVTESGNGKVNGNSKAMPAPAARPLLKLQPIQNEVRFENITFSYPGAPSPALENVSLTVPRGKCVAVVGRNGSGKTTLLALLPRFYDPQQGRVLIDGADLRDVTLKSLRNQISIVTQDSVIFPGTIAENIAYGHPLASASPESSAGKELREQVEQAAKRAFAHDFIMEKPQGYDSLLGGLGAQLSGGQKQRICIARAILRAAPILILDEATSQVDAESEALIQRAIESILHERTTFVIAHRFSTIKSADEIIVMERGQIVGQGSHDELLRNCETYQQLYEHQLFGSSTGLSTPEPAEAV